MQFRCFQIHPSDNVATLLDEAAEGAEFTVLGDAAHEPVRTTQPIHAGHKVALCPIAPGQAIVKYGYPIGEATQPIAAGDWVHLQNCRSRYDARSSELDVHSGVRGETRYA